MQRVGWIAYEILPVEDDGAARRNNRGGGPLVVIGKDHERAYAEASPERKPVERPVAGAQLKAGVDMGALFVEGGGVIEKVRPGAEVEAARERGGDIEPSATQAGLGFDAEAGKGPKGPGHRCFWRCIPQQALPASRSGTAEQEKRQRSGGKNARGSQGFGPRAAYRQNLQRVRPVYELTKVSQLFFRGGVST